jgi:hypothetical protein
MEDAVNKSDAGTLVGVLVGELDVDLPEATFERRCVMLAHCWLHEDVQLTLYWALEPDVELLPVVC